MEHQAQGLVMGILIEGGTGPRVQWVENGIRYTGPVEDAPQAVRDECHLNQQIAQSKGGDPALAARLLFEHQEYPGAVHLLGGAEQVEVLAATGRLVAACRHLDAAADAVIAKYGSYVAGTAGLGLREIREAMEAFR